MRIKSLIHKHIDNKTIYGTLVSISNYEIYIKLDHEDKISVFPKDYLGREFKIINDNK